MKKIIVLLAVASFSLSSSGQTTVTLQPNGTTGKDAEIFSCVPCGYSTQNFGNIAENCAIAWTKNGASHNIRSLIQFDLSSIPANATIQSAVLSLYFAPGSDEGKHYGFFGSNSAYLQRITSSWDEHTVTWNTQPTTTTLDRVSLSGSTSATQNYPNINVTQLIKDMLGDPTHSFGFMLRLQSETVYKKLVLASSDHSNATIRPKLVIVYTSHSPMENNSGSELRTLPTTQILKVYPNPARESVNLSINAADADQAFISIYDLSGREMVDQVYQLTEGKNQFSFETMNWTRGLYMVIVKTSGEMITEKLLLE
ncbi:MAG: DNRLRE domain-containing protein [Bacteroidetes bacterium]|nr:DNRLRE domain-containing protein [Bacteroidota bacterium]